MLSSPGPVHLQLMCLSAMQYPVSALIHSIIIMWFIALMIVMHKCVWIIDHLSSSSQVPSWHLIHSLYDLALINQWLHITEALFWDKENKAFYIFWLGLVTLCYWNGPHNVALVVIMLTLKHIKNYKLNLGEVSGIGLDICPGIPNLGAFDLTKEIWHLWYSHKLHKAAGSILSRWTYRAS